MAESLHCPRCGTGLTPGTLPCEGSTVSANWWCGNCRESYDHCFFCHQVAARISGTSHRCANPECIAHGKEAQHCDRCNNWSRLIDPDKTLIACRSPKCASGLETPPPRGGPVTPMPSEPGTQPTNGTSWPNVETILRHIASQSHFEERYHLHQILFAGGMGEVWRATDRILGREVAIKLMRPGLSNESARGQFLKEARIGGKLLHPNILPVFDLGVNANGQIYFTMRLVDGSSLWQSLDAVATGCATNLVEFPLVRVVHAFRRACEGVAHAHENGVLHLDLKPNNLLVSSFREVFVIDWGLARVEGEDDLAALVDLYHNSEADPITTHEVGGFVGTPAFMAPEQALESPRNLGPAADIYGLGGILFYILYGTPPNLPHDDQPFEIMSILSRPQQPGTLRHGILPRGRRVAPEARQAVADLEAIALRCLERKPAHRYPAVEDLIVEVTEWLERPIHGGNEPCF